MVVVFRSVQLTGLVDADAADDFGAPSVYHPLVDPLSAHRANLGHDGLLVVGNFKLSIAPIL